MADVRGFDLLPYQYEVYRSDGDTTLRTGHGVQGLERALLACDGYSFVQRVEHIHGDGDDVQRSTHSICSFNPLTGYWLNVVHCTTSERAVIHQMAVTMMEQGKLGSVLPVVTPVTATWSMKLYWTFVNKLSNRSADELASFFDSFDAAVAALLVIVGAVLA